MTILGSKTIHKNRGGQFVYFTDFHYNYNARNSCQIIKRIYEKFPNTKIFFGGDVITLSEKTKKSAFLVFSRFTNLFSFCKDNFFLIYGNHDDNSHKQKNQKAAFDSSEIRNLISNGREIEFFNSYSYFIDDEKNRTRYLCLDTGKQYLTETDIAEIKHMIEDVEKGWHIIVLTHIVYEFIDKKYQSREYIKKLLDLLDNCNKSHLYGKIECIVGGHIHNDFFSETDGEYL